MRCDSLGARSTTSAVSPALSSALLGPSARLRHDAVGIPVGVGEQLVALLGHPSGGVRRLCHIAGQRHPLQVRAHDLEAAPVAVERPLKSVAGAATELDPAVGGQGVQLGRTGQLRHRGPNGRTQERAFIVLDPDLGNRRAHGRGRRKTSTGSDGIIDVAPPLAASLFQPLTTSRLRFARCAVSAGTIPLAL